MTGQITRRPFTDCPYTWTTTITGISNGSGTVGNRQCRELDVGNYRLNFRACDSTGNKLIWVGQCFVPSTLECEFADIPNRNMCDVSTKIDVPGFGGSFPEDNFDFSFKGGIYTLPNNNYLQGGKVNPQECLMFPDPNDARKYTLNGRTIGLCPGRKAGSSRRSNLGGGIPLTASGAELVESQERIGGQLSGRLDFEIFEPTDEGPYGDQPFSKTYLLMSVTIYIRIAVLLSPEFNPPNTYYTHYEGYAAGGYLYVTDNNVFDFEDDVSECEGTTKATLVSNAVICAFSVKPENQLAATQVNQVVDGVAPPSIQIITESNGLASGLEGVVGADPGDRNNARWTLEYDIDQALWTLHSFNRIEYPIYTLADADPCVGLTKILTRVQASGGNGCEVSPDTVTITRGCPTNLSYRPRDARTRTQCARTIARKGCDCQNLPIDERWRSLAKCVDITTPGCEDYGDDVKCRYPKSQLSCGVCGDDDMPCTYDALFGGGIVGQTGLCDIIYEDTDSGEKTDIAASTVTMRQKCRFTNPCEWVAVGPTGNVIDGVVGKNPASAICSETPLCSSNCTWEEIKVSADAGAGNVLAVYGVSWELHVRAVGTTLKYNHPSFGVLIYTASDDEPWLCDNVNTLYLTSRGDLPDGVMPESICVRPRYAGCGGDVRYDIKSDAYDTVEHQIACCDPACGSIGPIPIRIVCCNRLEQCETTFVAQTTLLGIEDPAGPSYLGSCTLHGVLWTGVHYCDGNRWLADWYCGSPRVFFTTTVHTHDCCPLTISVEPFPENFGGVACCPKADCTCNLRDEVTLSFTVVEPGAVTASNCGPDPADCPDDAFDSPISITMPREGIGAKYVGRVCSLLGEPFEFQLTCGRDGLNDTDAPIGDYQLSIFPPGGFATCLTTDALRYSEMRQNQVSAPAILLEFDDYFCGDDHEDVDCRVFTNITITG